MCIANGRGVPASEGDVHRQCIGALAFRFPAMIFTLRGGTGEDANAGTEARAPGAWRALQITVRVLPSGCHQSSTRARARCLHGSREWPRGCRFPHLRPPVRSNSRATSAHAAPGKRSNCRNRSNMSGDGGDSTPALAVEARARVKWHPVPVPDLQAHRDPQAHRDLQAPDRPADRDLRTPDRPAHPEAAVRKSRLPASML